MSESNSPKANYISQAWLVILLALLYGSALAGIQMGLGPKIAENKRRETYDQIPQLVPRADGTKTEEVGVTDTTGKEVTVYQARDEAGQIVGWVLPAQGQGFADRIELLIGTDPQLSVITGLFVLDQKETPGLGDYITGEDFRSRFRDKSTDQPIAVVASDPTADNELRALTGATISSQSVADIVNRTLANLKQPIRDQSSPQ